METKDCSTCCPFSFALSIFSCSPKEFVWGMRDRASDTVNQVGTGFLSGGGRVDAKVMCYLFGGKTASSTMKNLFSFQKKLHGNDCLQQGGSKPLASKFSWASLYHSQEL